MESILRAASMYVVLLLLMRLMGRRALSEITTFDFVLLLIIGEATQQALLGDDFSLVNAWLVIGSLIAIELAVSLVQERWPGFERLVNGVPLIVVEDGRPLRRVMQKARVNEREVMEAARAAHGLERLEDIKFAVLERNGGISIIPKAR